MDKIWGLIVFMYVLVLGKVGEIRELDENMFGF